MQSKKQKIVVIGGGNGGAVSVVALKQNAELFNISAVVGMTDSGGSSGKLRTEYGMLPPGDIMRVILAMSRFDYPTLKNIFYSQRFSGLGELDTHNLGNLFLLFAWQKTGDFIKAVKALEQSAGAIGHVYPNILEQAHLVAELSNGHIIKTEASIDKPAYDRSLKIKKVWLEPEVEVYSEATKAIALADYIILGPGSLHTSIIAAILPRGIKRAIAENKEVKLIYVIGNACHTDGETGPKDVAGIVKILESYLPRPLDLIIYNESKLTAQQKEKYTRKGWTLLRDNGNLLGKRILRANYELSEGGVCPIKLGEVLKKILCR